MRNRFRLRNSALLLAAAALAGCSGQGDGGKPPAQPAPAWTGPQIAGPNRVVVARCDRFAAQSPTTPDARVHVVTIVAYSVADGSEVARQVATLPDGGSSDSLCDPTRTWLSTPGDRQAFNRDLTLVAGTVPGPGNKGRSATAFSVSGGSPVSGAAGADADDRVPVFQSGTSTLWYVTRDRHLASRDLDHVPATAAATDRGAVPGRSFVLADDRAWVRHPIEVKPDQVAVAPGGTVAVGGNLLWRRTDPAASFAEEYVQPAVLGPAVNGMPSVPGSEAMTGCAARLWLDDRTLLCTDGGTLLRVGFGPDHGRVEEVRRLTPQAPGLVRGVALAPDGRSVVFLRQAADGAELHRLDLAPGATATRIAVLPTGSPTATGQEPGYPHLIAWLS